MRRSWLWMLCLAGGLSGAGCADHGTYTVSWEFPGGEPATSGCGLHGVDGIRVTGTSTEGDHENFVGLCADGFLAHSVPVGNWTFMVNQLDVRGRMIDLVDADDVPLPAPTAVAVIVEDATVSLDPMIVELGVRLLAATASTTTATVESTSTTRNARRMGRRASPNDGGADRLLRSQ